MLSGKTMWIGFLIAVALYSVVTTIQDRKQRRWELLRKLAPFRNAFANGYYSDSVNDDDA